MEASPSTGAEHSVKLLDLIARSKAPEPWSEEEKIPWHDPGFSRRMLAEHLSQAHDRASRRSEAIDEQIQWIHARVLAEQPARVLDLGCGPGLYAHRLARLEHACVGLDISPASIAHATLEANRSGLDARFAEQDVRSFDPATISEGVPFSLAMLLFGEANAFRTTDLEAILQRAHEALAPGGLLLLEPHDFETTRNLGRQPPSWYTATSGLFSEEPHLCLHEAFWHESSATTVERWWIVDLATSETTRHAQTMQAYTDDGYLALLERTDFDPITIPSQSQSQSPAPAPKASGLIWLAGRRR
jgi:SAM-dependent methyltransferase